MASDTFIQHHEYEPSSQDVLLLAMDRLLLPLVRLCLANGVTCSTLEELLKGAFVQEALALQSDTPRHGTVSRISTATGLTRREVTRLLDTPAPCRSGKPTLATEIFARWTTDPAWRDDDGKPLILKRQGPEPSFEALAQSVTRDIHPRSMLDELLRLELAHYDAEQDCVALTRPDFVPAKDVRQLLTFLSDNVGDHFSAAVSNVLTDTGRHHEQAVFADELSTTSLEALRPLIAAQWGALRDALVPAITGMIEADRQSGRAQDQRIRIGLYTFDEPTAPPSPTEQKKRLPKRLPAKESSS